MTEKPKTVRVRIAVAVDHSREWRAEGSCSYADPDAREAVTEWAADVGMGSVVVHYIEADVPVPVMPASETVEGEVVE